MRAISNSTASEIFDYSDDAFEQKVQNLAAAIVRDANRDTASGLVAWERVRELRAKLAARGLIRD